MTPWGFEHCDESTVRGWLARRWYAHRVRVVSRALAERRVSHPSQTGSRG